MTRIFVVLGAILGALAALASLLLRSWMPLLAVGVVLLCVAGLTLSESAIFAPLLALVLHAGERRKKEKDNGAGRPEGDGQKVNDREPRPTDGDA